MWSLTDGILRGDGEDLTAAVFEAWTGMPASPRTPAEPPEPELDLPASSEPVDQDELNELNPPELWFWHHDLDEDELVAAGGDRAAAVRGGVRRERARTVARRSWPIRRPGVTDQESLLQDLRKAVVTVEPDWAALQPRRGFAVPGLDPDFPASGRPGPPLGPPAVDRQPAG